MNKSLLEENYAEFGNINLKQNNSLNLNDNQFIQDSCSIGCKNI